MELFKGEKKPQERKIYFTCYPRKKNKTTCLYHTCRKTALLGGTVNIYAIPTMSVCNYYGDCSLTLDGIEAVNALDV
jgi:hypothetical protein